MNVSIEKEKRKVLHFCIELANGKVVVLQMFPDIYVEDIKSVGIMIEGDIKNIENITGTISN